MKQLLRIMYGLAAVNRTPLYVNWIASGTNRIADALSRNDIDMVRAIAPELRLIDANMNRLLSAVHSMGDGVLSCKR